MTHPSSTRLLESTAVSAAVSAAPVELQANQTEKKVRKILAGGRASVRAWEKKTKKKKKKREKREKRERTREETNVGRVEQVVLEE
jgi:hypothetical protein